MKQLFYLLCIIFCYVSCSTNTNQNEPKKIILNTYTGWWVYGEGEHIFKDSETLEEWEVFFINDDKKDMGALYLEVAQMEYVALECTIEASLFQNENKKIAEIASFKITYIEGCGDN